jgi:DNA-binding NtrC family response regulator
MKTEANKPRLLVIDDERTAREGLQKALKHKYEIVLAESADVGLALLERDHFDVVLTDLRMPGMDGMSFTRTVSSREDPPLVIIFTAYGSVQTAIEAMKAGAYDYLTKPVNLDNLEMVVDRGLESRRINLENEELRRQLDSKYGFENLVGESKCMHRVFETVRQVADARSTVLLTGESGTGKELVARALHHAGGRQARPFVVVHCASLSPTLLESELFGHEKGAFTGAIERVAGRFEKADGGTLFLDEIGEIDATVQIKLLRVLETRTFERVGGSETIKVNVRLIAATNRDLRQQVRDGTFREDLFYRLNVVNINLPPLRERPEDIPLLLIHFLKNFTEENGKRVDGFTSEALKVLSAYAWPGNVRELRNCVERMVVMSRGSMLSMLDIPEEIRAGITAAAEAAGAEAAAEPTLDLLANERLLVERALLECHGNRVETAKRLGISRRTLYRKLDEFGLK